MNNEIKFLPPFKRMCMSIGTLPSSFYASMSYYESMVWLYEYLKNEVIPVVNNNSEVAEELQTAFTQLEEYISTYFENLDIQHEVDVKLDEMAEDGTLADMIAEYIRMQGQLVYDSVASMKAAENIQNGSFLKTYGYYSYNDGGGAFYKARTITNEDVIDNMTLFALHDNTLVAELIPTYPIDPLSLGAKGDGTNDDTAYIQKAISLGNVKLTKGTFLITSTIIMNSNRSFDGNLCSLKTSSGITALSLIGNGIASPIQNTEVRNLKIDTTSGGNGIYLKDGYFNYFDNINIIKLNENDAYGFKIVNGFNHTIKNSRVLGDITKTGQVALDISSTNNGDSIENMTNCEYDTLLLQNVDYGVKTDYLTTAHSIVFNNLGFSSCLYAYYVKGYGIPISINNTRIEQGARAVDCYGIYNYDYSKLNIDTLNVYNLKYPIYNNSTIDLQLNGQICFTGTSQSPQYYAIYSNGNVLCSNELYYTSSTYKAYDDTTIASGKYVMVSQNFVDYGDIINSDSFSTTAGSKRICKATNRVFNLYGQKGTELLVYTETSDLVLSGYGNSAFASNITMTPYVMYHIIFTAKNVWTVIQ